MIDTRHVFILLVLGATAFPLMGQLEDWRMAMDRARSTQAEHNLDAALAAYEAALQSTNAYPKLELARAMTLAARGSLLHDLERSRDAENSYVEALTLFRKYPHDADLADHVAAVTLSLASLYLEMDQPSKAVKLRLQDLLGGQLSAMNRGRVHGVLAGLAFAQRRYADAEVGWLEEIRATEAHQKVADTATALSNLGVLSATIGDHRTAAERLKRAVELMESAYGLTHPKSVRVQSNLGQVLMRTGQNKEGVEWLGKAYRLAETWFGAENAVTTQLCMDYAGALRKTGRKDEAKALEAGLKKLPGATVSALRQRSTVDVMRLK